MAQADAEARAALQALEDALTRREAGHALSGWPHPESHWSTLASVQGNGSTHVANVLGTVRQVVTRFPLFVYTQES